MAKIEISGRHTDKRVQRLIKKLKPDLNSSNDPFLEMDPDVLAYLWLAIESKLNVLITGSEEGGKMALLESVLSLVPRYAKVIAIADDPNGFRFYPNVNSMISTNRMRCFRRIARMEQIKNAIRMDLDVLVVDGLNSAETRELFADATSVTQFIATMWSDDSGFRMIKKLAPNPMKAAMQGMNRLDVEVHTNKDATNRRLISEVFEYKWLSRAEIFENGTRVGDDLLRIERVVENCATTQALSNESKVIDAYSKRNGLSYNYALRELRKRSDFLKDVRSDSKTTLETIERIYRYALVQ